MLTLIISKQFLQMETQPLQRCDNCLSNFPESKIATHFGYCRRNIKKCEVCKEMYDINFKEEHEEQFHRKDKCQYCKRQYPSAEFAAHEKKCDQKPKFCEYCELNVPVQSYNSHFKECQSRTKPCTKCNKPIMNKDYIIHIVSCPGVVEVPKEPKSYQDYVMQQQKRKQERNTQNDILRVTSKEKVPTIRPKEEKGYAQMPTKKIQEKRITYQPRILPPSSSNYLQKRQPPRQQMPPSMPTRLQPKRQQIPKRQQVKRYTGVVNVPFNNQPKKEEIRRQHVVSNEIKRPNGSRQGTKPQITNKEIFPSEPHKPTTYNKSVQRGGVVRRQEPKYGNQNINPRPEERRIINDPRSKIPISIPNAPKRQEVVQRRSPDAHDYHSQEGLGGLSLTPQEQMLQEVLMQSANDHRTKGKNTKEVSKGVSSPYVEGIGIEDYMNQSFIQKQKAIEEEISKQKRRR